MNMPNKSNTVSNGLLLAPHQLNIWFGSFILITGNISIIGNIIIFSSRTFRNRACTVYLLSESIILIFFLNFVLLTRILEKGFQIPILNRYNIICKFRYFATEYVNLLVVTLFILASLDRLLSAQRSQSKSITIRFSNHFLDFLSEFRKWSNRIDLAYKLLLTFLIIWLLCSFHRLIFYSALTGLCVAQPGTYALIDNYFQAVACGICPPIILFLLAYLLMKSVQNSIQRRITPANIERRGTSQNLIFLRKMDKQLTYMLLLQTLVAIPSFFPYAAELIYINITHNSKKSPERLAWESVFAETTHLLSYTFFTTQFYVSLISSSGIRKQILKIFHIKTNADLPNRTMNANTLQVVIQTRH